MAIRIREPKSKWPISVPRGGWQSVIARACHILQRENSPQTWVGPAGQGIDIGNVRVRARGLQIHVSRILWRHLRSIHKQEWVNTIPWRVHGRARLAVRKNRAVGDSQRFVRAKGILSDGQRF